MVSALLAAILLPARFGAAFGPAYQAASAPPPSSAADPIQGRERTDPDEEIRARMLREAAKQWNKQRQAALKKDTDKLLELATQLKQQVDKSNENILSLEVMKKSEEIERLAHNVHEKMKGNSY